MSNLYNWFDSWRYHIPFANAEGFFMLMIFNRATTSLTAGPLSAINDASVHGVNLSL